VETVKEGADGRRANVRAFTTTDIGALPKKHKCGSYWPSSSSKKRRPLCHFLRPGGSFSELCTPRSTQLGNASATQLIDTYWPEPDQRVQKRRLSNWP
jgi:hypothetical protein